MADPAHIIVGSGINGLVAAAMLARKGERVLVLERAAHVGGCMVSEPLTAPGYLHDSLATTFVLFLTGPAHGALGADLARHDLAFAQSPHPTGVLRPDGSAAVLTTDRAANAAAFDALSPGDGARFRADVAEVEAQAPLLFGLLGGPLWSGATAGLVGRTAWRQGARGFLATLGTAMAPARGWLEHSYASPTLQALLAPWVLHCGLSPEATYSAQMGKIIAFALEAAGAPIIVGGAGRAAAAFRALIEERGGEVRTHADVAEIIVRGGRAHGVRLTDGTDIVALRSVIASTAPGQLYGRLLPPRPEAEAFRHGRANFQLHYALKSQPAWATPGLDRVALLHLTDGIDAVSKSHNEAERGMLPETPTLCVGQPHALDPSRCPPGAGILWVQVPDAPRVLKGDAAGTIPTDGVWTEAVREAFADRIEGILAHHIPGFRDQVIGRAALSPADLEARNINLVGGDPYGGACTIDQFFLWRPFPGSVNHRTDVANLYHIGASTHPGPGLGGGSGFLVAKALGA